MKKTTPQSTPAVDFDLRQLEIFLKVVELESFSKAAEVVFLAQASVSERIANLENMVGLKLLDRLGRRVVPTKAGELLYKHALNLLEMKRLACAEMEDFAGKRRGEVRIGGSTIPGEYILPKFLGLFGRKNPLITLTLAIADSAEI
jgi:DNA-binding transcriptional LysR family regulator